MVGKEKARRFAGKKKPRRVGGVKEKHMLQELAKAIVGTALLPAAIAIDLLSLPLISTEDREASTPKIAKSICKNLEKAAGVTSK